MIKKSKDMKKDIETEEKIFCEECGFLLKEFDICDNMFCDIGIDNWNG